MAFNPTKPVEDSPLDAAEVRDQLNALKALIDVQGMNINGLVQEIADLRNALNAKPSMDDVNEAIVANSSSNSNRVDYVPTYASDPPTQGEVQSVIYKLNELIGALARQA